jgi:diguanylate cyclase (GGDEF)-like protein
VLEGTASSDIKVMQAEIERLRSQVHILTYRAERAEALAERDALTKVLNRRGLINFISRTMAYHRRSPVLAALIYLDLDAFKPINDELGHAAGDEALKVVASFLQNNVREFDAVGRIGGDEFAVVLLNVDKSEARSKAASLMESLAAEPFEVEGRQISLRGSFGVSALDGHKGPEEWLAESDAAMWLHKRAGR